MQKTFANIFLLLFLCLLFNIILVLYCYSDLGNSLQSDSLTVIDPVMLPNTGTTKGKRSLQQRDHYIKSGRWKQVSQQDPVEEEEIVQINNEEIDHQAKSRISKRRKQVSQPIMTRENQLGEMNNQNVDIMEDRDQQEVVQITVMLPNTGTTKGKRSLQQRDHYIKSGRWKQVSQQDPVEEEEIVQINNEEIDHQAKSRISKRRKQVSQPIMTRENQLGEMGNQNVDIMEDRDQQEVVQITDEYQHSYGQASYQRSRQGSAIAYEDSGRRHEDR